MRYSFERAVSAGLFFQAITAFANLETCRRQLDRLCLDVDNPYSSMEGLINCDGIAEESYKMICLKYIELKQNILHDCKEEMWSECGSLIESDENFCYELFDAQKRDQCRPEHQANFLTKQTLLHFVIEFTKNLEDWMTQYVRLLKDIVDYEISPKFSLRGASPTTPKSSLPAYVSNIEESSNGVWHSLQQYWDYWAFADADYEAKPKPDDDSILLFNHFIDSNDDDDHYSSDWE